MGKSGIKINLKGFERMLEDLQAAGGRADRVTAETMQESARTVETALRDEARASGVPDSITSEIRTKTTSGGNRYGAQVGWQLDTYDPRNPSAGYKAIFLNYGTVRRTTRSGKNRGAIPKRATTQQFIYTSKKKARPKVRKLQKEAIQKALEGLKNA